MQCLPPAHCDFTWILSSQLNWVGNYCSNLFEIQRFPTFLHWDENKPLRHFCKIWRRTWLIGMQILWVKLFSEASKESIYMCISLISSTFPCLFGASFFPFPFPFLFPFPFHFPFLFLLSLSLLSGSKMSFWTLNW